MARQAVLRLLRTRGHPCAAPRPPRMVGSVQGRLRRWLGRPPCADLRTPEGARRHPVRRRADRASGRDPCLGRHARRDEAGPRAADGGLRRLPRAHRPSHRAGDRRARGPRAPRRHPRLLHHRRQRRVGRGHGQRHVQRVLRSTPPRRSRPPTSWPRTSTSSARRRQQPLRGRLGSRDGYARISGRSRSRRTGAGRGTGRSSTGPAGSRRRARSASQFSHVIDVAATVLDTAGLPEPTFVHGVQQMPLHGSEHAADLRRRGGAGASLDAVLRDVRQPWHLPPGMDRRDAAQHAVGDGPTPAHRRRRLGAVRTGRLDAGSRSRRRAARATRASPAPLPHRGDEVRRPAPGRPTDRTVRPGAGRPADVSSRGTPSSSSAGWAGCRRTRSSTSRTSHMPSRPRSTIPDGVPADGVIVAQGGAFGGWALYALDGKPAYCYNLFGTCSASRSMVAQRSQRASIRSGWSSRTMAAGSARVGQRHALRRWLQGRRGSGGGYGPDAVLSRRDDRPRLGQRDSRERRLSVKDNRFTGRVRWVQIDLGADAEDADHLITSEERLRVAMARQ